MTSASTSVCFCLVSHVGPLEGMSALLVASLRSNLPFPAEVVVGVPEADGGISAPLAALFARLSVPTIAIENPISHDYKIGNKLGCLDAAVRRHSDKRIVFLDTDIVCIPNDFHPDELGTKDLALRVAGFPWQPHDWERAYGCLDLSPPDRVIESARTRTPMPPYYNAGVISIAPRSPFPSAWIDTCRRLHDEPDLPNKFPFLDQIGIPVTAAALNLEIQELEFRFNSVPTQVSDDCVFLHHHDKAKRIRENRTCLTEVRRLVAEVPEISALYPRISNAVKRWWQRSARP